MQRHGIILIVGGGMDVDSIAWVRRLARQGGARTLREAAGFSASEIARELDVDPSTISRWERGIRSPRSVDAERWAAVLRRLAA